MMPTSDGLADYARLFDARRLRVDRASLPLPSQYLAQHDLLPKRAGGRSVTIRCPVHAGGEEAHPSMIVSLVDGHFRCMTCGARGGDILALHRLATGKGFADALRDLGGRCHD